MKMNENIKSYAIISVIFLIYIISENIGREYNLFWFSMIPYGILGFFIAKYLELNELKARKK